VVNEVPGSAASRARAAGWLVLGAVVALLPWGRHHDFIRDFYDYGLVIAGVGRIAGGERPYVDFVTPIQSALFLLNGAAEWIGGGGFLGMVRGGAVFAAGTLVVLGLVLRRWWPAGAAAAVAFAVVAASAAQHTIIWHNTVGVACLALVAWCSAGAFSGAGIGGMHPGGLDNPAGQTRHSPWWIVLTVAGLWLGGLNKLNFHLLALAVALGWTLRAAVIRLCPWPRAIGLFALWLVAGVILPVATELLWTRATPAAWWENVVALPFSHRSGGLREALTWQFYLKSPHSYYGEVLLPQAGLAGPALLVVAGVAGWRGRRGRDRIFLLLATLVAAGGGIGLLATNFEISYIALAAFLVLAAALWLGFGLPARGIWFWGGLIAPALLIGVAAWWSAWLGQRSQFGHSPAARADYLPLETAGPAYAYMRGIKVPPEVHQSLSLAQEWLPGPEGDGRRRIFFGPGLEWMTRVFPVRHHAGLPLWMHAGTSYGPREVHRLARLVGRENVYYNLISPIAWAHWPPEVNLEVQRYYQEDLLGPVFRRWLRVERMRPAFANAIEFINLFGGNVLAGHLSSAEEPMNPERTADRRAMIGVTQGTGRLSLLAPTMRIEGEAVLCRTGADGGKTLAADFQVAQRSTGPVHPRWRERLELGPGETQKVVRFFADGSGAQMDFDVVVAPESAGLVAAGYRGLRILHVGQDAGGAPRLRPGTPADDAPDPAAIRALLPTGWPPDEIVVRRGRVTAQGLEIASGGEVWVRAKGILGEFSGEIFVPEGNTQPAGPVYRAVWAKASRIEIIGQGHMRLDERRAFRLWSAEPDAWFGLINEEAAGGAPLIVRVTRVVPAP
jgi:hypothetical protein